MPITHKAKLRWKRCKLTRKIVLCWPIVNISARFQKPNSKGLYHFTEDAALGRFIDQLIFLFFSPHKLLKSPRETLFYNSLQFGDTPGQKDAESRREDTKSSASEELGLSHFPGRYSNH